MEIIEWEGLEREERVISTQCIGLYLSWSHNVMMNPQEKNKLRGIEERQLDGLTMTQI